MNNQLTKAQATAGSQNFYVSLLSIVFGAFAANGLNIDIAADAAYDVISSGSFAAIVAMVVSNFLNPVLKLITKANKWSWDFLNSVNFWIQASTVLLAGISGFGIVFPESAGASMTNAIFGGEFGAIATALVINILNPLYHFFFDRK